MKINNVKKSLVEFISQANKIHDDSYDYTKSIYINCETKLKIICPIHGEFNQSPSGHLKGHGCPICYGTTRKTTHKFIEQANEIHNHKYDYTNTNYINCKAKLKIICPIHGEFEQDAGAHLVGKGCSKCANNVKKSLDEFIQQANKIFDGLYDYSKSIYVSGKIKLEIKCLRCGQFFWKLPDNHLKGKQGCPHCDHINKKTIEEKIEIFIKKAHEVHGEEDYDYSYIEYSNSRTKVNIFCNKCKNFFEQTPANHIFGRKCSKCQIKSVGEEVINDILSKKNILFEKQKRFEECKHKKPLPFDFYLPEYNICIEYNGLQHYKPVEYFGDVKGYEDVVTRDDIKKNYCSEKGIDLVIIKYNDNIKYKLEELVFKQYNIN